MKIDRDVSGGEIPLVPTRRRARSAPTRWLDRLPEGQFALVVAAPGLLLLAVFVLPPVAAAIGMSLFRIELLRDDLTPFVGLRNYLVRLPTDTAFLATLPRTLGFAILTSALAVPLALATAMLINGRGRVAGLLALVVLLPWAIAPIADGILWRLLFEPQSGILTFVATAIGLPPVVIRDAPGAFTALVVAVTWRAIPLLAVLFLGALRLVPTDAQRAARLDGASRLQTFRHITLPAIAPVLVAACLLQVILALQVFEVQYALSEGNPPTGSLLAGLALFNAVIRDISLGYGAALTVTLGLCIALVLGALYLVVRPRRTRVSKADEDDPEAPLLPRSVRRRAVAAVRGRGVWAPARPLEIAPGLPADSTPSQLSRRDRVGSGMRPLRDRGGAVAAVVVALGLIVLLAGPIVWVGIASTQPAAAFDRMPPELTLDLDLSAYGRLLGDGAWQGAAAVTVAVTVLATSIALVVAILAGYPLARFRFRGRGRPARHPPGVHAHPADRPRHPGPVSLHRPRDPRHRDRPGPPERRVLVAHPHLAGAGRIQGRPDRDGARRQDRWLLATRGDLPGQPAGRIARDRGRNGHRLHRDLERLRVHGRRGRESDTDTAALSRGDGVPIVPRVRGPDRAHRRTLPGAHRPRAEPDPRASLTLAVAGSRPGGCLWCGAEY